MPDEWELRYGLNPNDASDGSKNMMMVIRMSKSILIASVIENKRFNERISLKNLDDLGEFVRIFLKNNGVFRLKKAKTPAFYYAIYQRITINVI